MKLFNSRARGFWAVLVFMVLVVSAGCSSVMNRTEGPIWIPNYSSGELEKNLESIEALRLKLKDGIGVYGLPEVKNILAKGADDPRINFPEIISTVYPNKLETNEAIWLFVETNRETFSKPMTSDRKGETRLYLLHTWFDNAGKLAQMRVQTRSMPEAENLWSTRDLWLMGVALGSSLALIGGM